MSGVQRKRPNVVIVFGDQWRAQATGYAGDPNARTPHLDQFARESAQFTHAVATCPVCSPWRASFLTGRFPHRHGVFLNDVPLNPEVPSLAKVFKAAGYDTAYVGKWHIDGHGRRSFIPRERRQGFDYWKVLECTHDYNRSDYFGDTPEREWWNGYDAEAQTRDCVQYIHDRASSDKPFLLVLSWGPPHNPYETAPDEHRALFDPAIQLRPNVPARSARDARRDLAGYYAHISALDACFGLIRAALRDTGIEDDTLLVFTSDHGDMIGSQGEQRKQRPWDESIRIPSLWRWPNGQVVSRMIRTPFGTEDICPTLCSLTGLRAPSGSQGRSFAGVLTGRRRPDSDGVALIASYHPFGEWERRNGGQEYRGIRTHRYTYVRSLKGPWMLYDNESDPYQLQNLVNRPEHSAEQQRLEALLQAELRRVQDTFEPSAHYLKQWGWEVDINGTVPIRA